MLIGLKPEEPPTALRNILLRMQLNAIILDCNIFCSGDKSSVQSCPDARATHSAADAARLINTVLVPGGWGLSLVSILH